MVREDLIADLDISLKKALDAREVDLAGALYRLQGSVKGWCDQSDCGGCALAPHRCSTKLEETVEQLIDEHHTKKRAQATKDKPEPSAAKEENASAATPSPAVNTMSVKLTASRLHHQLGGGAVDFVSEKIRSICPAESPERVRGWQQVKAALHIGDDEKKFRASVLRAGLFGNTDSKSQA